MVEVERRVGIFLVRIGACLVEQEVGPPAGEDRRGAALERVEQRLRPQPFGSANETWFGPSSWRTVSTSLYGLFCQ